MSGSLTGLVCGGGGGGGGITIRLYVHSIVYPKVFLTNFESVLFRQGQ